MTAAPDVSVLIVSFNCRDNVLQLLASMSRFRPAATLEVSVIDNASVDGTVEAVRERFPDVTVIPMAENVGYGSAVNVLARRASGRYLLLLNPDTELTENAVDELLRFAESRPRLGVLSPRLVHGDGSPQPSARRFPSPVRLWVEVLRLHLLLSKERRARFLGGTYCAQDRTQRVDWTSGACHLIPRTTWEQVGPLTEETFCGFDDLEYCMRTHAAGLENWFFAGTEVRHYCGVSVNGRWDRRAVDDLAINNGYVVLAGRWGPLRLKAYCAAEIFGALTDVVLTAGPDDRRRAVSRLRTLVPLLLSRHSPVRRCQPPARWEGARQVALTAP